MASLTIVQMNDTHAYFDIHQEMFWQGDHAEYRQAGGYARIVRIQQLFVGNEEMQADKYYPAAFVTMQGVPQKYGRNRKNQSTRIIDALRQYLAVHQPIYAELRNTFVAV